MVRRLVGWVGFLLLTFVQAVLLLLLPLSVWLLFHFQTPSGLALAMGGVAAFLLPVAWLGSRHSARRSRFWRNCRNVLASSLAVCLLVVFLRVPNGRPPADSPIQHRFFCSTKFAAYSIANVVPEIEQINAGFFAMPLLDSIFSQRQARAVRPFTLALYREMEADPNFHQIGSVLGWSYAEMFGRTFNIGHYYLYRPRKPAAGPRPALVFLHGSLGNFKTYTWVWSKLAERNGMVVIAPSFGAGNWDQPGGMAAVLAALDDAKKIVSIDDQRIFLAGLSNGGLGVCRLAQAAPRIFRGLLCLSPVLISEVLRDRSFQENWRGRNVLVISGEQDERIPWQYVAGQVEVMKSAGVRVTVRTFPGEDHFLFFSQPGPILAEVERWMRQAEPDEAATPVSQRR